MTRDEAYKLGVSTSLFINNQICNGEVDYPTGVKFLFKKSFEFLHSILHEQNYNDLRIAYGEGVRDTGIEIMKGALSQDEGIESTHIPYWGYGCWRCGQFELVDEFDSFIAITLDVDDENVTNSHVIVYPGPHQFLESLLAIDAIIGTTLRDVELSSDEDAYLQKLKALTDGYFSKLDEKGKEEV